MLPLWLSFLALPTVCLTAQSTPALPPPPTGALSENWSTAKASELLVTRLTERLRQAAGLNEKLTTFERSWLEALAKSEALSSTVEGLRRALLEISTLRSASETRFEEYREAVAAEDQQQGQALEQARGERDLWRAGAVGTGVLALAAVIWGATR